MANDNMTIRFSPDGFSFTRTEDFGTSLDEVAFHEIAPGPDFGHRLQEQVLSEVPPAEGDQCITCQIVSTRVTILPPDVTDGDMADRMYELTLGKSNEAEQLVLQPIELKQRQAITLCFGIERSLYYFLQRNYNEVIFEHHLASLLTEGSRKSSGNCLVVRCDAQMLELAYFSDNKLVAANVYHATQADTRCYYVMNTWIQLGLDQLEDNLLVLSSGTEGLQIRASLHRFIKHVFS